MTSVGWRQPQTEPLTAPLPLQKGGDSLSDVFLHSHETGLSKILLNPIAYTKSTTLCVLISFTPTLSITVTGADSGLLHGSRNEKT